MLFLNIISVQFNAVFSALNESHKACGIKIFASTTRNFRTYCCTASLFSNLIPPLNDLLKGPNKWKSLGARSGLYSRCVRTSQPISAETYVGAYFPAERLLKLISYAGIHQADTLLNLRFSHLSRNDTQAQFSCSLMHLSLQTLSMLSAIITAYGTPMGTSSPTDSDSRCKNEQIT